MMYGRLIAVIILLNIPAYLFFNTAGTLFKKTAYICNFNNNAIILQSINVLFGFCALSCEEDKRCFSFQYDKQTQQCYTITWNIYGIETCAMASDYNEAIYLKELSYTLCPPDFDLFYNGSCYHYSGKSAVYKEASQVCADLGGYLASVNSLEENNKVAEFVTSQKSYNPTAVNSYFLGGTRVPGSGNPGFWKWEDGTDVVFENWLGGEPSGAPSQMCMYAIILGEYPDIIHMWGDGDCGISYSFVCERKP